jgi:hypothetical protein
MLLACICRRTDQNATPPSVLAKPGNLKVCGEIIPTFHVFYPIGAAMKRSPKGLAWMAVILLLLLWWLGHPLANNFDDGFSAGILIIIALFVCWPVVSKAHDAYLNTKEARKTPEQRRAEQASAETRMEALRVKWRRETTPKENRAKK